MALDTLFNRQRGIRTLLCCLSVSMAPVAVAEDDWSFYNAAKITAVETDFSNLDTAYNLGGLLAGFHLPGQLNWLSIEVDLSQTVVPGENQEQNPNTTNVGGGLLGGGGTNSSPNPDETQDRDDLALFSGGIFLAARTTGSWFVGGRIGYANFFNSSIDEIDADKSGSAFSALAGFRYSDKNNRWVELEFTSMPADVDYISLNLITSF